MSEVAVRWGRWRPRLVSAVLACACCLLPRLVAGQSPDKAACVAAYEKGQNERKSGALKSAKQEFSICADAACPDVTKGDCTTWSAELDASIPTVTFIVKDESGADLTAVAVSVDGAPLASSVGSTSVVVDPGSHRFRFEAAGLPAVEQTVLLREGEKNRQISVVLKAADGAEAGGKISPATWVLAGVGGAGLIAFGVLGGIGLGEQTDAEDTCAPSCSDDVIDPIRTKFIAADVALSVGLASLGAALVVGLVTGLGSGSSGAVSARFEVRPAPGGGAASFAIGF